MKTALKCPKCGSPANPHSSECTQCRGAAKNYFLQDTPTREPASQAQPTPRPSGLEALADVDTLLVKQNKEWGEILTGLETKNHYDITDDIGRPLMEAREEGGSSAMDVITRSFLKALRPFTISVTSREGVDLLRLSRPFRFYFHELEICKPSGAPLGKIRRQFSILRRVYSVFDRRGNEIFQLFGPLLHPWTFHIRKGERDLGKITKKWSGLAKESFTDADNFGIKFPRRANPDHKAILLGAVFLIDFVHFENSGDNRN